MGEQREKGLATVIVAILAVAIVVTGVIVYLATKGASQLITKDPSEMVPTSADMPGWTSWGGSYLTAENVAQGLGIEAEKLKGYNKGYVTEFYKLNIGTATFMALTFSSVDEAMQTFDEFDNAWRSEYEVSSVTVGDQSFEYYKASAGHEYRVIMFRKTNVIATVVRGGDVGASTTTEIQELAAIMEGKIS